MDMPPKAPRLPKEAPRPRSRTAASSEPAARAHEAYVRGETLARSLSYEADGSAASATIDGRELRIAVARA